LCNTSLNILLNLGIGLFNLVPLGPVDGGRMLRLVLHKFFEKKRADKIWKNISVFFLTIILINILAGFIF
jgi:membrane-associated protease RseP (regulator of RpoE activity)